MKSKSVRILLLAVFVVLLALAVFPVTVMAMGLGQKMPAGLFNLLLTPENLTIILVGLMAIAFDWFPGLAPWFDALSTLKKKQLVIVILLVITGAVFAGSCYGLFETGYACSKDSLPELIKVILLAAGANQAVHLLTKPESKG